MLLAKPNHVVLLAESNHTRTEKLKELLKKTNKQASKKPGMWTPVSDPLSYGTVLASWALWLCDSACVRTGVFKWRLKNPVLKYPCTCGRGLRLCDFHTVIPWKWTLAHASLKCSAGTFQSFWGNFDTFVQSHTVHFQWGSNTSHKCTWTNHIEDLCFHEKISILLNLC